MSKKIKFSKDARKSLKNGIDIVFNSVAPTIGPKGRNVAYDKGYGGPVITNDGVSIAKEIVLSDPMENMGANLIKDVALKTNDIAGDGTTTSVVLTHSIVDIGMKKAVNKKRVNIMEVKKGIDFASKLASDFLKDISKPINTDEDLQKVARISAESEEIGKTISDTVSKLGKDAVITVEESPVVGLNTEVAQGLEIDKGFISHFMITNAERSEAVSLNPHILVTDMKVGIIDDILPLLEEIMQTDRREIVIVAEDVVGEALQTFIVNKMRGALSAICIKAPGFGLRKKDYLEDIATVVGARFISSEAGDLLKEVKLSDLGSAEKVISTKDKTTFVGGKGNKEEIEKRVSLIKKEIETTESSHDKIKLEERVAKINGGVAIIKVGASTEADTKYLRLKVEDAVSAVKAALEEGIVVGGGVAFIRASNHLEKYVNGVSFVFPFFSKDEKLGIKIVKEALESPLRNIAKNAGLGNGDKVVKKVKKLLSKFEGNSGYDALNNTYHDDLIEEAGIIDPVKVTISAIKNSCSAGGVILTTECAIVEDAKNTPPMM